MPKAKVKKEESGLSPLGEKIAKEKILEEEKKLDKLTPEEEKGVVKKIMDDKKEKDVKAGTYSDKEAKSYKKDDEERRKATKRKGKYQMITLGGDDRFRIVGKLGEWVSQVLPLRSASKLVNKINAKDPEQKAYNLSQKPGKWREPTDDERAGA